MDCSFIDIFLNFIVYFAMHPFALARFKLKTNCYNIDWAFFRNINFLMVKKYYILNKKILFRNRYFHALFLFPYSV